MGNCLRGCLGCVLPCGALDLIRVVHLNGHVEEITPPVKAGDILSANPDFVLSKPCYQGVVRRILIISPDSELKRGNIYFLIPASSLPVKKKLADTNSHKVIKSSRKSRRRRTKASEDSDRYLRDVASEKKPSNLDRRRGRTGVWHPHLESIVED